MHFPSHIKRKLFSLLCFLTATFIVQSVEAQILEGHVTFGDSAKAAFATVYVPATGQGTVTDQNGFYMLDELPKGKVEVEFSYLGYRTARRTFTLNESKKYLYDERLEEQPIALGDVYITPNGEDPAIYILRKVAERAASNKKRLQHYEAQMEHLFHSQDVDFLPAILPKPLMWTIRQLVKAAHRGAIFDFCVAHESADARLSSRLVFDRGKCDFRDEKLLSATPAMPDKARDQLMNMTHRDPFERLYGDETDYCLKVLKKGKCGYKLKGTFEENGLVIDVLENPKGGDADDPCVVTLYIVEDDWGILRMEEKSDTEYQRTECRNIGSGIYLPVSHITDPSFKSLNLDKMLEEYQKDKEARVAKGEKIDSDESKFIKRMKKYAESHTNPRPCITTGYSIIYGNVKVN